MNKKRRKTKKLRPNVDKKNPEPRLDSGGYDWGWPTRAVITPNSELLHRLAAGGFVGCGYGVSSSGGLPFISLVGTNLFGMKSALALMGEWVSAVGANAVNLEILFDGPGYVVTISQQFDLLRLRLAGLDTTDRPLVLTMGISKRLDTRSPFLDSLAKYCRQPIAPIVLTVAGPSPGMKSRKPRFDTVGFQPVHEGEIILPGISIYERPEDRPRHSMVTLESEVPPPAEPGWPPVQRTDPSSIGSAREQRLLATFPKTMHVLRHRLASDEIFLEAKNYGCSRWQTEQAICNMVLSEYLPSKLQNPSQRLALLDNLRREFVEHGSPAFDARGTRLDALLRQVALDAAYLLKHLDEKSAPPADVAACNDRLRELGYV